MAAPFTRLSKVMSRPFSVGARRLTLASDFEYDGWKLKNHAGRLRSLSSHCNSSALVTDPLDFQVCHRVRSRLVSRRAATIHQIRAFLIEQGIAVRAGAKALRTSRLAVCGGRSHNTPGIRSATRSAALFRHRYVSHDSVPSHMNPICVFAQ